MKSILDPNRSYSFSDYFYLLNSTKEVVAEFGYGFSIEKLQLPKASLANISLERLKNGFYKKLPFVNLSSETAKREFYVSPIFFELLDYVEAEINIEYALNVSDQLKGNIDYLLRSEKNFVVVEAKYADLEKGFTQLAVEMIAVDKFMADQNRNDDLLFGAVTVGDVWRFGTLDRNDKIIKKDIEAILLPSSLEDLFAILLGILQTGND